jgi:DNA helicase-2/ATP-dependent DNA helicase PcrA
LRIDPSGRAEGIAIEQGGLTPDIARAFWTSIRKAGFVDFANIIYYSLLLLQRRPEVLSYVASKFAWILVDEFQDTTDLQVEILTLIAHKKRTRFLLVGDPYQPIYRFAGAKPELVDDFSNRIGARQDISLSGNFRSSPPIIARGELLYRRVPPMTAVGKSKKYTEVPTLQHGRSTFEVIADYFLPALEEFNIPHGEAAILAPTWFPLFPLGRQLRDYGVTVVGPGARPYRRSRQFAPLAEQVCGYLMEPSSESVVAIERTLFNTILDATGRAYFDIFSYRGRTVVFRLLAIAERLQISETAAVAWLEAAVREFSKVLLDEELFTLKDMNTFIMSVEQMKSDMRNNKVDFTRLAVNDLGVYASPNAALKLSTLHNAKGREYIAVAMIDLHEGRIPSYRARTPADVEEQKRLFYVGVTRLNFPLFTLSRA